MKDNKRHYSKIQEVVLLEPIGAFNEEGRKQTYPIGTRWNADQIQARLGTGARGVDGNGLRVAEALASGKNPSILVTKYAGKVDNDAASPVSSVPFHGENVPAVVNGERRMAFVPGPLSSLPALDWERLAPALAAAGLAVGALRGIDKQIPNIARYLDGCVWREALFSSQIEGTQSSLDDLLLSEEREHGKDGGSKPSDDDTETSNYVKALKRGLKHLRGELPGSLPLSLRLLCDLHRILLQSGRGAEMGPGEFRRSQNRVGEHVPPPPNRVPECMGELENFIANPGAGDVPLIRAGLAHVQFETIHPFRDGNGRVGRLLIVLMLINEGVLNEPWLYVSLPIKKSRGEYYDRLDAVRKEGDWTGWLLYFLRVAAEAATAAEETAREVSGLFQRDAEMILDKAGARSPAPREVHQALQRFPISSIRRLEEKTGFSKPAVKSALDRLGELGIVRPFDGRRWGKRFVYHEYMEILRRDGEPL